MKLRIRNHRLSEMTLENLWMKNIEHKRQVELMDEHQSGCQGTTNVSNQRESQKNKKWMHWTKNTKENG